MDASRALRWLALLLYLPLVGSLALLLPVYAAAARHGDRVWVFLLGLVAAGMLFLSLKRMASIWRDEAADVLPDLVGGAMFLAAALVWGRGFGGL